MLKEVLTSRLGLTQKMNSSRSEHAARAAASGEEQSTRSFKDFDIVL